MVCAQAAFEKDPFTLSENTPVDLISSMTKIYEDALSGSGGLYAYVESQTGVKPTSYEHAYSLLKDKATRKTWIDTAKTIS